MLSVEQKAYKGLAMEGFVASWYAKLTRGDLGEFRSCARAVADRLPFGAHVLEIAPGPGYLSIELARLGAYRITGLDISASFVRIATENAEKAGVEVRFQRGDAHALPFPADSFDFIICRAAFKNFRDPVAALKEMHRVLKPGGATLIIDMRKDAADSAVDAYVDKMNTSRFNRLITRWTFNHVLRKRAYSMKEITEMVAATSFESCAIGESGLGMEISLRK
jgi:ubiquinone/menaquinone biosynthesis C-methylase UbiE